VVAVLGKYGGEWGEGAGAVLVSREEGEQLEKTMPTGEPWMAATERGKGLWGSSRADLLGCGPLRGWAASVQFPFSFFSSFFYSFLFS
jgi:hypothetical protein